MTGSCTVSAVICATIKACEHLIACGTGSVSAVRSGLVILDRIRRNTDAFLDLDRGRQT